MKLRNKKTGEIGWLYCDHISVPKKMTVFAEDKDLSANHWDYKTLAELNAEWEDYEEPKEHWYIDCDGEVISPSEALCNDEQNNMKQIGNSFETKEEAEKAVEKLKAWGRLKKHGFGFYGYTALGAGEINFMIDWNDIDIEQLAKDMNLLFGGEE